MNLRVTEHDPEFVNEIKPILKIGKEYHVYFEVAENARDQFRGTLRAINSIFMLLDTPSMRPGEVCEKIILLRRIFTIEQK